MHNGLNDYNHARLQSQRHGPSVAVHPEGTSDCVPGSRKGWIWTKLDSLLLLDLWLMMMLLSLKSLLLSVCIHDSQLLRPSSFSSQSPEVCADMANQCGSITDINRITLSPGNTYCRPQVVDNSGQPLTGC